MNLMRILRMSGAWLLVFVLCVFAFGCSGGQSRKNPPPPVPSVNSTSPANGATGVPLNQKISAAFSVAMNPTSLSATAFTVTSGGAAVAGAVTYAAAGNAAIFTPAANLAPSATFTATITTGAAGAAGGALAANYVWTFKTGTTTNTSVPTVTSTNPADTATSVSINQKFSATFSTAMDPSTISGTTFTLAAGATAVSGTVTYSAVSNSAIFAPAANLAASTQYTATVTTGAKDLAGNALAANFVWTFTTGTSASTTAPTITVTNPANAAPGVALSQTVNATFSEAMDPTTITTANFTLAGPSGSAAIVGVVTYDPVNFIATFTPNSPLTASTQYTAKIGTGVKDQFGNALASGVAPNPWSFTTGTSAGQGPIDLGSAGTFGAFGGSAGITNQGINTVINGGDIGTTAASTSVTGFHDFTVPYNPPSGCIYTETTLNVGAVNGTIFTATPPPTVSCPNEGTAATAAIATQAEMDSTTAYNSLVAVPAGSDPGSGQLGGLTLAPGTYTSASGTFLITGSDLTLDAQGDANAVWVFQMSKTLTVGDTAPRNVILAGGAQAKNVFWQVGSAATINGIGGGTMMGTIIAQQGVTFSTPGNAIITTLNGRALSLNASVTMVN